VNSSKYIGMDVHTATICIAVRDAAGKLIMESVIETKASTILQFIRGLRGDLHVTFEEGTWAAWLYDLLKPYVTNVVVCNPRRSAYLPPPPSRGMAEQDHPSQRAPSGRAFLQATRRTSLAQTSATRTPG
jgi:hypothetical protein